MWITQLVPLNIKKKKKKKKKKKRGGRRRRIPFFLPYLMLLFFITILPFFLLFSNSFPLHTLPSRACEIKLLSIFFWQQVLYLLAHLSNNLRKVSSRIVTFSLEMSLSFKMECTTKMDNVDDCPAISVLDLPDLALNCILGKLKPIELCKMAGVCSSLRGRCRSDYLWERHMREKWGRVVGRVAKKEREWYLAMRKEVGAGSARADIGRKRKRKRKRWSIGSLVSVWPLSWLKSRLDIYSKTNSMLLPLDESIMSWYLMLENGKFWFPAQVYNREHGHVGFMLSCYDADLSYNFRTDRFQARYPPHGRTVVVEEGVEWERIRPPPIDTPAYDLHASDCLHDLHPGNHIEIQWRRNKEFPYGWWYGIVGHLESCDGSVHFCRCHKSDTVVLEFNQYTPGSRWGRTTISRKSHREQGSEADGFYGGIRKLYTMDEISTWKQLWPVEVLE